MVASLRQAASEGRLHRFRPGEVDTVLDRLMQSDWVVYTKDCLEHTGNVVEYLARYTHRIAITNARILSVDECGVRLRYKDYRDGDRQKVLRLEGEEFVRRFLLHFLSAGLMRVRHFGFLANRCRRQKLSCIREAIAVAEVVAMQPMVKGQGEVPDYPRPNCGQGWLRIIAQLPRRRGETTLMIRRR